MYFTFLFSLVFVSLSGFSEPIPQGFSPEEMDFMAYENINAADSEGTDIFIPWEFPETADSGLFATSEVRPFAEYEKAGYVIFSSGIQYASGRVKRTMAKHLPDDVTLVVYTQTKDLTRAQRIHDKYADEMETDRVKVVYMPRADRGFWARDGVPVPVIRQEISGGYNEFLTLVDARYYHKFEPDKEFASLFQASLTKHSYYFEGGNFIANTRNDCLVVNTKATKAVPTLVFREHYGCRNLIRLPFVKGIGHADESVKFMTDDIVITDESSYVSLLESYGFEVRLLPRPSRKYETYINSLIVNDVVFVPIFDQATDNQALDAYREFGFEKVIGINSENLSNKGLGSIHCITMSYPNVDLNELIYALGGHVLVQ